MIVFRRDGLWTIQLYYPSIFKRNGKWFLKANCCLVIGKNVFGLELFGFGFGVMK